MDPSIINFNLKISSNFLPCPYKIRPSGSEQIITQNGIACFEIFWQYVQYREKKQ